MAQVACIVLGTLLTLTKYYPDFQILMLQDLLRTLLIDFLRLTANEEFQLFGPVAWYEADRNLRRLW